MQPVALWSRCQLLVWVLLCALTSCTCSPSPVDYAAATNGATISGPTNASMSRGPVNCAIDGQVGDYGPNHGYAWADLATPTIISFARPVTIDTVEVITTDFPPVKYSYHLSVSLDGQTWQPVADAARNRVSGWQIHRFAPVEASHLQLRFTHSSAVGEGYHLVEVGAFQLGARRQGPLGMQWAKLRPTAASQTALLGVPHLQALLGVSDIMRQLQDAPEKETISHRLADGTQATLYRDGRYTVVVGHEGDDKGNIGNRGIVADGGSRGPNDIMALDSDGDGFLDRTLDYKDTTGDGLVDTMVQTYLHSSTWGNRPFMVLVRALHSHPLRLWHLHDYGYWQHECQWHCDFAGNGYFAMFRRDEAQKRWVAAFENPFCFYDHDDDGFPEETVRIVANDTTLRTARYSINVTDTRPPGQLYGYDVGITCLGRVEAPEDALTSFVHRSGEETGAFLDPDHAREVVREADWARALLVWDENDHNVASSDPGRERWEGILNSRYRDFPQEGGPPCGRLNKRYELDRDFSGAMKLYYWQGDGRLHLHGAEHGTMEVDYDYDGRVDMVIEYEDTTGDGFFDRRTITYADPKLPRRRVQGPLIYRPPNPGQQRPAEPVLLTFSYPELAEFWPQALQKRLSEGETVMELLTEVAGVLQLTLPSSPMDYYHHGTGQGRADMEQLRASEEARRYYQDVTVELMLAHMVAAVRTDGTQAQLQQLQKAQRQWDAGHLALTAATLRGLLGQHRL